MRTPDANEGDALTTEAPAKPSRRRTRTNSARKTSGAKKRTGAKKPPARGRGRPPRIPTPEQIAKVEGFARLGMDTQDIAWAIDFPRSTFYDYLESHFSDAIKRGKAKLKLNSGMVFVREMNKGNITAGIWLEKTRLGMTERVHTVLPDQAGAGGLPIGSTNVIAVGIYLPANGREVEVPGSPLPRGAEVRVVPADQVSVVAPAALSLPSNGREIAPLPPAACA